MPRDLGLGRNAVLVRRSPQTVRLDVAARVALTGGHGFHADPAPLAPPPASNKQHYRYHQPHLHLAPVFGTDWFALKAEAFARFFGTPVFLVAQTVIVGVWILAQHVGVFHFDIYPFILLNLAFSLQAAYAAPLILLAQTRQADRDKAHAEADAQPPRGAGIRQRTTPGAGRRANRATFWN